MPLLVVSAWAAEPDLKSLLKTVENRYNRAQTLEVTFHEAYTGPGRPRQTESGTLRLRKPGRMRWDYTSPAGKLFLSDGKNLWLYTPANHRVEKMSLKETENLRAPLAFLLGKLNFQKEFQNIQSEADPGGIKITAEPKSNNLPYTQVVFVVGPDNQFRRVQVTGYDHSILEFTFEAEKLDVNLDAKLFRFEMPPGAELAEENGR